MGGHRHTQAALPPGKTPHPLYRRLGGPQSRSGRVRKISSPIGIRSPDRLARSQSLYRLRYPAHEYASVALLIQHAKCIRRITASSVACLTRPRFPKYLINDMIFGEKKFTDSKMCLFIFSTNLSETFIILRGIRLDNIKNVLRSSCKVPVILVRF